MINEDEFQSNPIEPNRSNNNANANNNYEPNSEIEIDKYMNLVENEIKKCGQTLNDSLFISQIIIILDKLSSPKSFNKTLFFHIIEYAGFDTNKPIKLLDFFRSFFSVYESMKHNRDTLAIEVIDLKKQSESLQKKLSQTKSQEIIHKDGVTSNSSLRFIYRRNATEEGYNIINLSLHLGEQTKSISIDGTYSKDSIDIHDMDMVSLPLYVYIKTAGETKCIDSINIKNILETPLTRSYQYFSISFLWINSLVSYINRRIGLIEVQSNKNKESINVLNTLINQMEEIFKNYFSQIPRSQYSNIIGGSMGNELEVSDKIEHVILRTIGREIIIWETIANVINKALLVIVILQFINRFDIISFICSVILLGIELKIVTKSNHLYQLILGLTITLVSDTVYLVKGFGEWNERLPFEFPFIGRSLRLIAVSLCVAEAILKIVIMFSLWRMALEEKLISINKVVKQGVMNLSNNYDYNRKKTQPRIQQDPKLNEMNYRLNTLDPFL